jgi:hypothetical protein
MRTGEPARRPERRDEGIALLLLVLLFAIIAGIGIIVVSMLH